MITDKLKRNFEDINVNKDVEEVWLQTKSAIQEVTKTVKTQRNKKKSLDDG